MIDAYKDFIEKHEKYLSDKPTIMFLFENVVKNLNITYQHDYDLQDHCEELSGMKGWIIIFDQVVITDIDGGLYFCVAYDYLSDGSIYVKNIIIKGGNK